MQIEPAAAQTRPPVLLDLTVTFTKVSGTVTETAKPGPLMIEGGVVNGKAFTFKTTRQRSQGLETLIWKGELIDGETIMLVPTLVRSEPEGGGGVNPIRGGMPSRSQGPGSRAIPKRDHLRTSIPPVGWF